MDRRRPPTAPALLTTLLLGLASAVTAVCGPVHAAWAAAARPASAASPAPAPAAWPARGSTARTEEVHAPAHTAPDAAVRHGAGSEQPVRHPAAPPALAPGGALSLPPADGTDRARPAQDRAPPRDALGARHSRAPPSTRHHR
ncbi:hypothetical protein NPS70_09205 [Streptomyces sp. C10-9-1]|uniref:hypothetical protein n=1 Tax=Streptomyces sp. C10-9-1 TaxID=1859285 RepID=UPI002112B1D4|nr:hypothetical protein [Streptomyces sp. C10-9-1]MCQ6553369.1 hypothetical protein [Streptomyces sp. C10-9-1]